MNGSFMQKRRLGRTKLQVSQVGFGAHGHIIDMSRRGAVKVIRRAFDLGVNYFDTARSYDGLEEKLGFALKDVRDECVITTKIHLFTRVEAEACIRQSLHYLNTDRVDVVLLHGVDDENLKRALGQEGAMEALKKARSEGKVDFTGVSSHIPHAAIKAIQTEEFDVALIVLNPADKQFEDDFLPLAKKLDVGVTVMKSFGAGWFKKSREWRSFLGSGNPDPTFAAGRALRFVLSHDDCIAAPSPASIKEVETAVKLGGEFKGLSEEERRLFALKPREPYCRACGLFASCKLCLPCPEMIPINFILAYYELYKTYGLKKIARNQYRMLSIKADCCTKCGKCEPRCLYKVPIIDMLKEAEEALRT